MGKFCFVIMPFGGKFDELYQKIYAPAIREVGLEPLRADEIYDNQAIIQDIDRCIQDATLILADVTGRNPNVNYELGAAHALKKEAIILTADSKDVPSDYRHLRYLSYNVGEFDWNRKLSDALLKTLRTVLERHSQKTEAEISALQAASRQMHTALWLPEIEAKLDSPDEDAQVIARARALGFDCQTDSRALSHALLRYQGSHVMLDRREGPVTEWDAAAACLLCEKVRCFSHRLPQGHLLRMRSVFYDLYAVHVFQVDYLYQKEQSPLYTAKELCRALENEFSGQVFVGRIRYLEENLDHDHFNADDDRYYSQTGIPLGPNHMVCWRDGSYVADLSAVFSAPGSEHSFYKLDGLLPQKVLDTACVPGESHWLADWGQSNPRFRQGDTVKFQIYKIYPLANRSHVKNARNISFSALERA